MIVLASVLAFMLGGSIGFTMACMIAAGRVADLRRENQRLKQELEGHQYGPKVVAEQTHVIIPKPSVTVAIPRPRKS
jgi:hypothetical protein